MTNKAIYIMGDFNIDLLKYKTSHFSHNFLLHPQSCYLIPTVDKPTRVHRASATLIDNILVNNPDKILASGNIVTDVSDHFSQICVTKSAIDKFKGKLLLINSSTTQNSLLFASMMIFPMLTGITFLVAVKIMCTRCFLPFIRMCNQIVTSEIREFHARFVQILIISRAFGRNYQDLDKTQVKLFPNFTSIPFDYLLISWVTNYVSNLGFLQFILDRIDRELHSLKCLDLKFGL